MWRFRLMEFDGTPISEVFDATERKVTPEPINRPAVASFKVRGDHPLLPDLFAAEDRLLQVWDDSALRFHGYVTTSNYEDSDTSDAGTVQVNAVDSAWRLSRVLAGLSAGGTSYTDDKAQIAFKIIAAINAFDDTGVKLLPEGSYAASGSGTYVAGPYKAALTCINDVSNGFDGFDWRFKPLDAEHPKLNQFEAQPTFGETKPVVLERGWGSKNVTNVSYLRDLTNIANIARHLPDEGLDTEGAVVVEAVNTPSIEARGHFETTADAYGLVDTTLRTRWVEEVVRVKGNPRYVVGMRLAADNGSGAVPRPFVDFAAGDFVTARAVVNGVTLFNGLARVYAIEVELNDAGRPSYTPILIDEEGTSLAS